MIHTDELWELAAERIAAGQRELAEAMRVLVAREAPDLYEALSDAPDGSFLEPLLFSYFSEKRPSIGLPQILFGSLPPTQGPEAIEVRSDALGRVHLPGVGYLSTAVRDASLVVLTWNGPPRGYVLHQGGRPVPFQFEDLMYVPGTRIEVVRYGNPLLASRFFDTSFQRARAEVDGHGAFHLRHVERALELIRANCPAYYAELARVTRQVVVFSHTDVNSFASINVHGTAFFNAGPEHDHVFFMDELVHQCGHVIFNALTVRRKDFLAIDPTTSLRAFAPREQDARTVYDALHGLYTEHVMSSCMRTLDEAGVLSGRQAHELFGRLSFITRKYRVDLRNLSADGMFTELGAVLYTYFQKAYDALVSERPELLATDMSGQPYNFSYELFAQHNPPRADRASHRIAADHAA